MSATFDIYVPGRSWLHQADPRVKIAFVAFTTVLLLIWFNLPLFLLLLVLTHVALIGCGIGWRRIGGIWRALAPFLILIFLLWPVFARQGTPVLLDWGPLRITGHGIIGGAATATRFAAISFAFIIWLATTDQRALVRSFVRLGLPYSLGMSLTIGLRFIPTFAALFQSVSEAQQSQGSGAGGTWHRPGQGHDPDIGGVVGNGAAHERAAELDARGAGLRRAGEADHAA